MNKAIKLILITMALYEYSYAKNVNQNAEVKFQIMLSAEQLNFLVENGMLKIGDSAIVKVQKKNPENVNDKSTEYDNHEVYKKDETIIYASNGWKAID